MNSKSFWTDLENEEFAHVYSDEMLNIFIATQLRVLRGELSQEELARKAGMKQERISLLENVNYSSWSVNTLRRLAKAFDLRLKISFESFGTLIEDINNLNATGLKRVTRKQEIGELKRQENVSELTTRIVPVIRKGQEKGAGAMGAATPVDRLSVDPFGEQIGQRPVDSLAALAAQVQAQSPSMVTIQ